MPDLVTHLSIAYLVRRKVKFWDSRGAFYLGTIIPDILTRPITILFPNVAWAVMSLHTPIILFIVCWLISYFFAESLRKGVFISLVSGVYLHLFLDSFQKHVTPEYKWLFPFSWKAYEVGLFWAEDSLYTIPFWIFLILVTEFISKNRKRSIGNNISKYKLDK